MEYSSLTEYSSSPAVLPPALGAEQGPKPGVRRVIPPRQAKALVLAAAFAVGVALRLAYFFSGRSLWIDEARVALNIASRNYPDLLLPLDYDQAAPPFFLWLEKAAIQLFGVNERAYWLLPLACGIGAMVLFLPLARRWLPGWSGVLAAAALCVAPTLMHYSAVAKPYMADLTVALAIIAATYAWIERPESRAARALPWIGALGAWASTPAVFTLAAAGVALVLAAPPERRRSAVSVGAVWGASFLAAYGLAYRGSAHSEYLHQFWDHAFIIPWHAHFLAHLAFIRREVLTALSVGLHDPATSGGQIPEWFILGQRYGSLLLVLIGAPGMIAWARRRPRWESVLVFGPLALLLAAAAVGVYPASSRLVMFLVPAVYLAVAAGTVFWLGFLRGRIRRYAARSVIGVVFAAELFMSVRYLIRCPTIENVRDMVDVLDRSGDVPQIVYVHAGALPAWALYTTDWDHPDRGRLALYAALGASNGPAFENAASRGRVAPGEGWDLRFSDGRRREVFGIPAGVWKRARLPGAGRVDVGWVENEVDRIERAGRCQGGAWVLLSHADRQDALLLRGLAESGGRERFRMTGLVASLTRFEFGRPSGPCH
jgi:4-amino-4-deoxy-L-arabinose transferase-like glycosyltransferase